MQIVRTTYGRFVDDTFPYQAVGAALSWERSMIRWSTPGLASITSLPAFMPASTNR